ncbi:unnamed protein product, partial [Larinioides sclopetarius]
QPYDFGYSVRDHHSEQHRQEAGNGHGAVVGSYGFKDARGIARQVNYVADHGGFRAQVNTNEPGTANQNPAAVRVISHQPHAPTVVGPLQVRPIEVVAVPAVNGHGTRYGLGHGDYRVGYDGHGYAGALDNTGLGGYSGGVNFVLPLNGGDVRGYDSRFANVIV